MKRSPNLNQALFLFRINALLIFTLAFSLAAVQPASAQGNTVGETVWYVTTTGNDANSCSAIDAPCLTINGAIGKAAAGDTVKVAIGTYTGTGPQVILINKSITLSGGWDEIFTTQSGISMVDGKTARTGIYIDANLISTIDHFTISNGRNSHWDGGGIVNYLSTLTLNNINVNNSIGKGIANYYGTLALNNSTINEAEVGTYNYLDSTFVINNSTISNNWIGIINNETITLQNSIIDENGSNCAGTLISHGYNIISDITGCSITPATGDQFNVDPQLGFLLSKQEPIP